VKAGRRIDAELLSPREAGWKIQLMHSDGTEFFAWRFPLKGGHSPKPRRSTPR
jgi:hypothetical protein